MNMWIKRVDSWVKQLAFWAKRVTGISLFFIGLCAAEEFNLRPAYTFMFAVMWLTGMNFVLEFIEFVVLGSASIIHVDIAIRKYRKAQNKYIKRLSEERESLAKRRKVKTYATKGEKE